MSDSSLLNVAKDDAPQLSAMQTMVITVPDEWIDYNGHMTEWQYYKLFADSGDVFLRAIGFTEDYRHQGYSFFNVQGQQRNLRECRIGSELAVYSEIIGFDDLRLHLYQYAVDIERQITVATGEHMLLHVDTTARRAVKMEPCMYQAVSEAFAKTQPKLAPKGVGQPFFKIA
ncbi:thioesterase family protein [Pseudomonas sp. O230]|uniref:thioesterase family protein n=1 Tax=Pseudomonas sp. O230 TaxID=3159450 RepID=UPI00387ADB0B